MLECFVWIRSEIEMSEFQKKELGVIKIKEEWSNKIYAVWIDKNKKEKEILFIYLDE